MQEVRPSSRSASAVASRRAQEHPSSLYLRERYEELINQQRENSDNLSDPTNTRLMDLIDRGNQLQQHVASTQDASFDSEHIRLCSYSAAGQVSRINTITPGLDLESFIHTIKEIIGTPETQKDGEVSWGRLAERDLGTWRKVPRLDAVLGTVELGLDEKALAFKAEEQRKREEQRQLRRQQTQTQTQALRNRGEVEKTEAKNETRLASDGYLDTEKLVTEVKRALDKATEKSPNGKVSFWDFVTNPMSFGESVENLFYTSFLIKNGKAKLEVVDDVLYISPSRSEASGRRKASSRDTSDSANAPTHQSVASLNYKAWKELSKGLEGAQPMIERPKQKGK